MAIKNGSAEVIKLLLSAGASIYRISRHGETAFAHAVRCGDATLLNFPLGG
jgi:ankyrin repeat protein